MMARIYANYSRNSCYATQPSINQDKLLGQVEVLAEQIHDVVYINAASILFIFAHHQSHTTFTFDPSPFKNGCRYLTSASI